MQPKYPGIEFDHCRLCKADSSELLFMAQVLIQHRGIFAYDEWPIVRCQQCGLIYQNPRPDSRSLDAYYLFETSGDQKYLNEWFIKNADNRYADWKRFIRILKKYNPNGYLLDIGCGAGHFLLNAREEGYKVIGQEVAPYFINYCTKEQGLIVLPGPLLKQKLNRDSFDIVTLFDVLEHLVDPVEMITEIHRLLKPDGIIMITTHNINNIFARIYGKHWRHIIPIGHLTYFSVTTLKKMLQGAGYKLLSIGGAHTIEKNWLRSVPRWIYGITKYLLFRLLVVCIYFPLSQKLPILTQWKIKIKGKTIDHKMLQILMGDQIIMNDDIVLIAQAIK